MIQTHKKFLCLRVYYLVKENWVCPSIFFFIIFIFFVKASVCQQSGRRDMSVLQPSISHAVFPLKAEKGLRPPSCSAAQGDLSCPCQATVSSQRLLQSLAMVVFTHDAHHMPLLSCSSSTAQRMLTCQHRGDGVAACLQMLCVPRRRSQSKIASGFTRVD